MPENNLRQAMIPEGAEILPNRVGTAPGVYLKVHGAHVFCLPGVPGEMRAMWKEEVAPRLSRLAGGPSVILSKTLRFYGIGESALEERVNALPPVENPTVAPYASVGEVRPRITTKADSPGDAARDIELAYRENRPRAGPST